MRIGWANHLKWICMGVVLAAVATSSLSGQEPSAESLKKCPLGHANLKNVPLVYGFPPREDGALKEWNQGIQNLEFAPGGCASGMTFIPGRIVVCTTCKFGHSIDEERGGSWWRTSPNFLTFLNAPSPQLKSFPVPPKGDQIEPASYLQCLNDSLEVTRESLYFRTREPLGAVKDEIDQWLRDSKLKFRFVSTIVTDDSGPIRDILTWKVYDVLGDKGVTQIAESLDANKNVVAATVGERADISSPLQVVDPLLSRAVEDPFGPLTTAKSDASTQPDSYWDGVFGPRPALEISVTCDRAINAPSVSFSIDR